MSLDGIAHFNFVDGASNTDTYCAFWEEVTESVSESGLPALQPGDIIVVDNCPIHRNDGEIRTSNFLDRMGIGYIFLPTYSPDFNPAENVFGKLKAVIKQERFVNICLDNLKVGVSEAPKEISIADIRAFYRNIGYLNV